MVQVTGIEAQTISAEAANHLRANNPIPIPGPTLTQQYADAVNAQLAAQLRPFLKQLRSDLRLDVKTRKVGGTPVVVITPRRIRKKRRDVAGFFAHAGGFALLSGQDYNAYRLAHDLGIVVYSVNYGLSPRVRFPVALNQTIAAHRALAKQYPKVLALGSSAGANLLITTILRARRSRATAPRAAGLFSPVVDIRAIGDSYVANDGRDPLISRDTLTKLAAAYLGTTPATNPDVSPILADYRAGFVPTILTTGTRDLLQTDSTRFTWTLRGAGVPVHLRVWEGMWHGFEAVPGLPEGEQNMREVFGFLAAHI